MLERAPRVARLQAVSNVQHEIGADRGILAEIAVTVAGAGRFAVERDPSGEQLVDNATETIHVDFVTVSAVRQRSFVLIPVRTSRIST